MQITNIIMNFYIIQAFPGAQCNESTPNYLQSCKKKEIRDLRRML